MNELSNGAGCSDKQKQPIESAMEHIHKELEQLKSCVATLEGRLSSITLPIQPSPEKTKDEDKLPEMSEFLESMKRAVSEIRLQRLRISGILTRMQI